MLGPFLVALGLALTTAAWGQATVTGAFQAQPTCLFLPDLGPSTAAVELVYPAHTVSTPGQFARWPLPVASPGRAATLSFYWADSFTGPTAGYHVLQVVLGDKVLWEHDVAGGDLQPQRVELPLAAQDLPPAGQPLDLAVRLLEHKLVTNFPVRVQFAEPTLHVGATQTPLLERKPLSQGEPWPPEAPLPALPVVGDWTWQANIIQPWGTTQTVALKQAEVWAPRFAREHGLNAIIVLPPEAHNAITGATGKPEHPDYLSDADFRRALALYRREGVRLILYTSIMHMGHAPQWQFGELGRTHPEWSMRDAAGDTVNMYGQPWLCPSTGALQATLDYTAGLVRAYDAEAVMLDNNEFMKTNSGGWTCHCAGCQAAWRQYLVARFGDQRIPGTDLAPATAAIPAQDTDPLWGLWLSFRNRTWARACETYRRELRQVKPDLVVLANTQYVYASGLLAVDGQYAHLDAVLSESRGRGPLQMAGKMLLGRALAEGRPLWNYIGTFDEEDYKRLRPADEVAGLCAASTAVGANPWIVFYGFTGEANQPSLAALRRYTAFWHGNVGLLADSALRGDVGFLISTETRDLLLTPLQPAPMNILLREGFAVQPVRDCPSLTAERFGGLRALLATANPCMTEGGARAVADWVRQGGVLVITPQAGWCDEYGRWRTQSALSAALGSLVTTPGDHPCGRGRVRCVSDDDAALQAARQLAVPPVRAATPVCVVGQQTRDGRRLLSLLGLEGNLGDVTVALPDDVRQVELRLPGHAPQALPAGRSVTCSIPERLGLIVY